MHPNQIPTNLLVEYGDPMVQSILRIPIVNFPNGRPRWKMAKRFALAGELNSTKAKEAYSKAKEAYGVNIPTEVWDKIGEIEGLDKVVKLVPEVEDKILELQKTSRIGELSFDQQFYDSMRFIFTCIRDCGPNATCYPLMEGPPGASKTQVAAAVTAIVQRPLYPVIGGDGAADEIKAALLGGPYPSDKSPWAIAKENCYIGGLRSPAAERKFLSLLKEGPFEAITQEDFKTIAEMDGIREGITYDKKGAYQLASENGGILLLEECNSFPAEVHSQLTQILENYVQGDMHPNFFIIATQNPAGEKHPSRNPLPPEVVNRMERYRVEALQEEQYSQAITFNLTREQPSILLASGKKGIVTPAMLGMDITPKAPHLLADILTSNSLRNFVERLARFHKTLEEKIESGILDPKEVQEPPTKETTFMSRRNIRRLINGIESELMSLISSEDDDFGSMLLTSFNAEKPFNKEAIASGLVAKAINTAITRYYIQPNSFATTQKFEVMSKEGKKATRAITSTGDILKEILKDVGLDQHEVEKFIVTSSQSKVLEEKFNKFFSKAATSLKCKDSNHAEILKLYKELSPTQQESVNLLGSEGELTMAFQYGQENPFDHIEEVSPLLTTKDDKKEIAEKISTMFQKRIKAFEGQNLAYLTTEELKASREWINSLRKEDEVYLIPAYHESASGVGFCLVASIHKNRFHDRNDDGVIIAPSDIAKKKDLEKLLNHYDPSKANADGSKGSPWASITLTLYPRTHSEALQTSPYAYLRNGTFSPKLNTNIKIGEFSNIKIGFLEVVKWKAKKTS